MTSLLIALLLLPAQTPLRFSESTLPFRFENGSRGKHDLVEIMGGGVGLIDFDGDGLLDVYLCQGGAIVAEPGKPDPPCRLFRNKGGRAFEDVTERVHAPGPSYAMGVAVGDYDGDGRPDLLVTGWRGLRLYRNRGGSFEDVTARAGVASDRWTTSAAFADFDRDGDLDLYVATYVDFDPAEAPYTAAPDGKRDYPGPEDFSAQPDHLFRNNGDGTFTDVAKAAGVEVAGGRDLGVIASDFDGDGLLDIYTANDGGPCRLFRNLGGFKFEDVGMKVGVALDGKGDPLAGMGIARGDVDGDGRVDLAVTNFHGRSTILFRNEGKGGFVDGSEASGVTAATRSVLGFGVALADFDLDGQLDLIQANGHVLDRARLGIPFAMRPTLLRNQAGKFKPEPDSAAPVFARPMLGRGLAAGDLDNDGKLDAVITSLDAAPVLLWNETGIPAGINLEAFPASGGVTGTRITTTVRGRSETREIVGGGSYLSASDQRVLVRGPIDSIEAAWPSGRVERWRKIEIGPSLKLREGTAPR